MRFDLLTANGWESSNEKAREFLAPAVSETAFEARVAKGQAAGLLEVFTGTASFLSHRRTLGLVVGKSWVQEAILPHLLRENFAIKTFTMEQMRETSSVLEQLGAECSCFLWPEDHPVTGELYDGEALEEELVKKRIFSIRLSHHAFRTRPLKLRPYAVRLCAVDPSLSVALLGARFKTPSWIAPLQSWNPREVGASLGAAMKGAREDEKLVRAFEGGLRGGWQPLLSASAPRLWDRAIVHHPEISGDEALHELRKIIGAGDWPPAGLPTEVETLHLCRWDGTMKNLDWWAGGPKPDQVRGLVALDVSFIDNPRVRDYFGEK